jgi:pimeloyl-ACP methyl ester carboxylesterase
MAAIEWIAQRHRIDRKRIATYGEGVGAHFALRATQLYPDAFRCAIVFAPTIHFEPLVQLPPNLDGGSDVPSFAQRVNRRFLEGSSLGIDELSTTAHPEAWSSAVFIATPMEQGAEQAAGVAHLRAQLGRRDLPVVQIDYHTDFTHGRPVARARVYRALDEFINLYLYHYDVKIGPTRVVK